MSEIRNRLVLQVDAKGAQGAAKALNQVGDALGGIADQAPDDMWDGFDDAAFDQMAGSIDEAADAARSFADAIDDGAQAVRDVTRATERQGKATKDMTDDEKRALALQQAREKAAHDLAATQDAQVKGARAAQAVEMRRQALAVEMAALGDSQIASDRQRAAIIAKMAALDVERAQLADGDLQDGEREVMLLRESQRLQAELTSLDNESLAAERQAVGLRRESRALEAEAVSLNDAELQQQRENVHLLREAERINNEIAAQADGYLGIHRRDLAVQRQGEALAVEMVALGSEQQAQQRAAIAAARTREQITHQIAATEDEVVRMGREVLAADQQQIQLSAQMLNIENETMRAQRVALSVEQQRVALVAQLDALNDEAQQDAQKALASLRQRQALEVQITTMADQEQAALRDKVALERQLEQIRQQRAQGRNAEVMLGRQQVELDRQRAALALDFQASQDASIQGARQQKWIRDQVFRLEREIADVANPQIQGLRAQLEMEKLKLKLVDEILEIEQGRGGAISDANALLRQDTADLREKLKMLEQEKSIQSDIREMNRVAGPGGDLRAARNQQVELETLRDHNDETVRLQRIAGDKTLLRQMRAQESLREKIRLGTRTWRDYVNQYAELLEKVDSSIQVWFTLGMVLEKAWEVFLSGAISAGIKDANERLGELAKTADILAGTEGLLTQKQAGSASLRAAELGVSSATGRLAGFAGGLGGREVMLGESEDIGGATVAALKKLQEEFAKGELGQSFKDLGTSQAEFNNEVRKAAAQRGVLPEALDLQTRQQILLAQATKDSTLTLSLYHSEQIKGAARVKNFFADAKASLGEILGGGAEHNETVKAHQEAIDRNKRIFERLQGESYDDYRVKRGAVGEGGAGAAGHRELGSFALDAARRVQRAEASMGAMKDKERLVIQRSMKDELIKQADALLLINDGGADQLLGLMRILELQERSGGFTASEAKEFTRLLDANKLITYEMLAQMRLRVGQKGIAEALGALDAHLLPATIKANEAKAAGNKLRLEAVKFAQIEGDTTRFGGQLELAKNQARLQFETTFLKYQEQIGASAKEASERLKDDRVQMLLQLDIEQAVNDEKKKLGYLLTENQKKNKEARSDVLQMKEQILGASDNMEMFNRGLGQAVAVQAFKKLGDDGQLLLEKLAGGKDQLDQMVTSAGGLAFALNEMSSGRLFSDGFLEGLFKKGDEKKDDKRGGGGKDKKKGSGGKDKKNEDDLLERLRREKIAREIAAAEYSAREQLAVTVKHLDDMRSLFAPTSEDPLALTFMFGGNFDADLALRAQELQWWYRDTLKQAGERSKERLAVEEAFEEKKQLIMKEAWSRQYLAMLARMRSAYSEGVGLVKESAKEAAGAWHEVERKWAHMTKSAAEATQRIMESELFDGSGLALAGERALTQSEIGLRRQREALAKERDHELASYEWTAQQKFAIELDYQMRLQELEQESSRVRLAENNKLREAQLAIAQQGLDEVKELMGAFSDEARSMSEGSKATFQGGISTMGQDMVAGFGAAQVGLMGLVSTLGEVDEAVTAMGEKDANGVAVWSKALAGAGAASMKHADSIIDDERKKAAVKGAIHAASAIGQYAMGDVIGGTMHALAAAQFFAIAGTAKNAPAKAKKAEATKKTALSATTVALSRDRGPTAITNVFIEMQPIDGRSMVSELNRTARTTRGTSIDARLIRPTATIRTDL